MKITEGVWRREEKKKTTKEDKVLGEECSESEYIYYKGTDRNFYGDARLSFWKTKVWGGVNVPGITMLKTKMDISEYAAEEKVLAVTVWRILITALWEVCSSAWNFSSLELRKTTEKLEELKGAFILSLFNTSVTASQRTLPFHYKYQLYRHTISESYERASTVYVSTLNQAMNTSHFNFA
jgi:hypothetical protein